jgi:hypothetical protein
LQRYRPIVATATILVLVSGFAILAVRLSYVGVGNLGTAYHVVFGIKLLVALGLIGLAHAGFARSAAAETDEQAVGAAVTPTVALVAALVVMLLGIALHRL